MKRRNVWLVLGIAAVVIVIAGVALWNYHEQPQFCAICHIMQPYLESWESPPLLAYAHAEDNVTCLECHEPTIQQQVHELKVYVQGDFEVPLEERKFPMEFCFGCHEPNEHTSYEEVIQRTEGLELNPHDSHLGEIECRICHNAHRASEDYCAPCHGPVATGLGWTTEVSPTTKVVVWKPDMDCTVCHVMVPYFESLQDPNLLAYAHAQEGLVCLDCHHDQAALQQVHERAVPGTPIKERKFEMDFCFDCHVPNPHTSYEEIVERTEDYTVDDEKINPHAITVDPANPNDPHSSGKGEIECYQCHKMHKESPGINYCYSCHHTGDLSCGGCHPPNQPPVVG